MGIFVLLLTAYVAVKIHTNEQRIHNQLVE